MNLDTQTTDWYMEARRLLRVELAKKDIGYKQLVRLLERIGVEETDSSIANKLSRGSFSFAFFLQCMKALEVSKVDLDLVQTTGQLTD